MTNEAQRREKSDSTDLLGLLPKHNCGLYLTHNAHKDVYDTAEQWIADNDLYEWKDDDAKARAIETDSIWTLLWYSHTSVGFCAVAAPTLTELLALANEP